MMRQGQNPKISRDSSGDIGRCVTVKNIYAICLTSIECVVS